MSELVAEKMIIKITSTTHIQPRKKLGRKEVQLVTFDLPYLAFFYNQKLMIYKSGANNENFEEMVTKLKNGVSILLEEFYELAGRLGKDEEDGVFKVIYDDDMDGIEVNEAVVEGVGTSVNELIAKEDMTLLKELVPYNGILNLEGLHRPLLAVQLTRLRDGIAIGCAFNHAVLDGSSTWHFMSSWAEICSGSNKISVQPFHDRTKARNTRIKLNLTPPSSHAPPPKQDDDDHSTTNGTTTVDPAASTDPPLREKVFKFSESAIEKIKSKANINGSVRFSTFQSLSAHIWKAITAARQLKPEEYTVFTVFVDCRKRVDPPMPESYFGNLIQAIFTVTSAGLVLANQPEFGAEMIKTTIEAHDAKAIEKRNKEWEEKPIIFQYKDAGVNCVAVGSSPRFKVYDVDFGWGKPESVRSGCNNRFDGMVYLYPGKNGGKSIDVEISLEVKAMENLEKDKEFLMEEQCRKTI